MKFPTRLRLWIFGFMIDIVLFNGAVIGHLHFHSDLATTLFLVNAMWLSMALFISVFWILYPDAERR